MKKILFILILVLSGHAYSQYAAPRMKADTIYGFSGHVIRVPDTLLYFGGHVNYIMTSDANGKITLQNPAASSGTLNTVRGASAQTGTDTLDFPVPFSVAFPTSTRAVVSLTLGSMAYADSVRYYNTVVAVASDSSGWNAKGTSNFRGWIVNGGSLETDTLRLIPGTLTTWTASGTTLRVNVDTATANIGAATMNWVGRQNYKQNSDTTLGSGYFTQYDGTLEVPYTGAIGNVNLGSYQLTAHSLNVMGGSLNFNDISYGVLLVDGSGDVVTRTDGASGKLLMGMGTTSFPDWTTPTYPNTAPVGNKVAGDGTNWTAQKTDTLCIEPASPVDTNSTTGTLKSMRGLHVYMAANETWSFNAWIDLKQTAGGGGVKFAITVPTSATIRAWLENDFDGTQILITASATATIASATGAGGATNFLVHLAGVVVNGANAGNIQPTFESETAGKLVTINPASTWMTATKGY